MAKDANFITQSEASEVGLLGGLKVYSQYLDFTQHNLAQNAHAEIFQIPAGAQVLAGQVQILTEDAGGGKINIGVGGTGTELMDSQVISAKTAVKVTAGGVVTTTAADTIDLWAETAAITLAKVRVTLLVLLPGDIAAM
jgi:hypothetical protein